MPVSSRTPARLLVADALLSGPLLAANVPANLGYAFDGIIPRSTWDPGYQPPSSVSRYAAGGELHHIVIHHSDFDPPEGPRGILDDHLEVSGFADIGYHFAVAADGRVYEGRPLGLLGAHAGQAREANRAVAKARKAGKNVDVGRWLDPDWGAVGIVLDGYDAYRRPPRALREALVALVAQLRRRLHIPVDHVITHREVKATLVEGEGLTFTGPETVCPGDALQAFVEQTWRPPPEVCPKLNAAAATSRGAAGQPPSSTGESVTPGTRSGRRARSRP